MLLVLPPDEPARLAILERELRDRPTADLDLARLATRTEAYSGADLRLVCESAAEYAIEASMTEGRVRPIVQRDLELALHDVRPSTRPWLEVAKNYAMFANADGTFDELLEYMRRNKLG
jgi:SpoVK/Ycf46/Vps4 family AAA+-type ATPase